jgi:hypothetical protein
MTISGWREKSKADFKADLRKGNEIFTFFYRTINSPPNLGYPEGFYFHGYSRPPLQEGDRDQGGVFIPLSPSGYLILPIAFVSDKGFALVEENFSKSEIRLHRDEWGYEEDMIFSMRGGTGGTHTADGCFSEDSDLAAATRSKRVVAILSVGVKTPDTVISAPTALAAKRYKLLRGSCFCRPFVTPVGRRRNIFGLFSIQSREYLSSVKTNNNNEERGKGKVCAATEDGQKLRNGTHKQEKHLQEVSHVEKTHHTGCNRSINRLCGSRC